MTRDTSMKAWLEPIYRYMEEGHSLEETMAVFGTGKRTVFYALALWGVRI